MSKRRARSRAPYAVELTAVIRSAGGATPMDARRCDRDGARYEEKPGERWISERRTSHQGLDRERTDRARQRGCRRNPGGPRAEVRRAEPLEHDRRTLERHHAVR